MTETNKANQSEQVPQKRVNETGKRVFVFKKNTSTREVQNKTNQTKEEEFDLSGAKFEKEKVKKQIETDTIPSYNPKKSFWDNISCDSDTEGNATGYTKRVDYETFGSNNDSNSSNRNNSNRRYNNRNNNRRYNSHNNNEKNNSERSLEGGDNKSHHNYSNRNYSNRGYNRNYSNRNSGRPRNDF